MTFLALDEAAHTSLLQRAAAPAPVGATLRVLPSQSALFVAMGRVMGILGPGQHLLDPARVPFLGMIVQPRPMGPVLGDDLYWAKTGAVIPLEVTTTLFSVEDATLGEKVAPKLPRRP